jgi:single-strand DNA-binding protein
MANLNKVMLIGRLTADPEVRTFANGGKVAKFRFAVNNSKKNQQTGEWENDPVFIDIDVFNRGEMGKLADRVEQTLRKGQQIFVEGRLKLDQWTSKEGEKRSKLMVVADNFQYLEPRGEGSMGGEGPPRASSGPAPRKAVPSYDDYNGDMPAEPRGAASPDEDIPF